MKQKVKLLIESNNKLLLLKPINKTKYSLIGGTVEKGETPIFAGIREGFEEAGLSLSPSDFKTYLTIPTIIQGNHVQFYCYLLRRDDLTFELKEQHKFESLDWVSLQKGITQLKGIEKFCANFFNGALLKKDLSKKSFKRAI